MSIDKHLHPVLQSFTYSLTVLALAGTLVLAGCDSDDTTDPLDEIASVEISPDTARIAVGERIDFSVVARNAAGERVPAADLDLEWQSTDPSVFAVEDGGSATGEGSGTAFCTIATTNLPFVGRDSAFVSVF